MLEISDANVVGIIAEFSPSSTDPLHALDLEFVLRAAHKVGLLGGIEVYPFFGPSVGDDWTLLTVRISSGITVMSGPIPWGELSSAKGLERPAEVRYILSRLDEIAQGLSSRFNAEATLRAAPELKRVRYLVRKAEAINKAWAEASAKHRDAAGVVAEKDQRRYDELRIGAALDAWKVSSALAEVKGL
ncbi:hypothetical protein [Actinacidiphila oryziradicis]|uniref:Uncharacterized protein n=1 Tax=Actinacidiphila oryziradicis TaxID=2571141 RepID=A0A4U0RX21_9ACTN|nr:hypothetical protein [Actinacidiphila oryziradicis]TKA00178.1 hypothetical protein FCI23_43355 [Actinacidiphila oryziradicis]